MNGQKTFNKNEFDEITEIWCNREISSSPSFMIIKKSHHYGLWSNQSEKWLLSCQFSRIEPIWEDLKGSCIYEYKRGINTVSLFKVYREESNYSYLIYDSSREQFVYDNQGACLYPIVSLGKVKSFYVVSNNKAGIINREGNVICPLIYDSYCPESIPDRNDYEFHLFGQQSQDYVLSYKLVDENEEYVEQLYYVLPQNRQFYLFNESGSLVINRGFSKIDLFLSRTHHYEYLGMPYEGVDVYFRVVFNNKYGLYDSYAKEVFPCVYDKLEYIPSMDIVIVKRDGYYQIYNMDRDVSEV